MPDKSWWIIDVAGYGDFAFFGTEAEAEARRVGKAQWEGGVGKKRLALSLDGSAAIGRDNMLIKREVDQQAEEGADA